jgi:zinc transporter, ZIP family
VIDYPLVTVILFSTAAAAAAVLGVLPSATGREPSLTLFGWANALASGLMLGVAYTLLTEGLHAGLAAGGVAALFGIGFVRATHSLTGTTEPPDVSSHATTGSHRIVVAHTLHAAHEGIAIGAAMALSPALGIATAVTLAVHNIPEAMVLTRALEARGLPLPQTAGLAIGSNANQIVMAVAAFLLIGAVPAALPWVTGFAVGAFVYLVLVELLPESYHQAGHTSIALVTLAAMGMVVLLTGLA